MSYLIYGTKGQYMIVGNSRISLTKNKRHWLDGSREASTLTFFIDTLVDVQFIKPTLFKHGCINFVFEDKNVNHIYTMGVKRRNRNRVESVYKILKNKIYL